jgi:hypothetical protein
MSGMMRQSFDDTSPAQETEIIGGTDQTKIGNTGDRLKVDATISGTAITSKSAWSPKLVYQDMNASTGGIARGTSITAAAGWTTIYNYAGSGQVISFLVNLDTTNDWYIRFTIDDTYEIFTATGILGQDMTGDTIYDLDDSGKAADEGLGVSHGIFLGSHNVFNWQGPLNTPIPYASRVKIQLMRAPAAATKKFNAGLIVLTKET